MNPKEYSVLVLDDDEAVRNSFADFFEDQGWRVILAGSGEEALAKVEKTKPQAAVIDIRLPGMDGNTFIRNASKKFPFLVYVICTGSHEYELPHDLIDLSQVSKKLFFKPVMDLNKIKETSKHMIQQCLKGNEGL